jgi:hypothetical protein
VAPETYGAACSAAGCCADTLEELLRPIEDTPNAATNRASVAVLSRFGVSHVS